MTGASLLDSSGGRPRHNPALDGLRGLAIILVMVHHYFQAGSREPLFVDSLFFGLANSGWFGVDLFFVLSGFLITGILYDSKGTEHYFRNFYARRSLRIFPLYYATLFLFFVVFPLVPHPLAQAYVANSAPDQLWFWAYLTNFRIAANGDWYEFLVPTVFWSLAIEEQFYLIWPLVVLKCTRNMLIRICIVMISIAFVVRVWLITGGANPLTTFVITPARMDCLAVGALLALIVRGETTRQRRLVLSRRAALVLGASLLALAMPSGTLGWTDPLVNTLGLSLVALFFGALLLWAYQARKGHWIRAIFKWRPMRIAGKYSYSMYIFHGPAGTVVKKFYDPAMGPLIFGSAVPRTIGYALLAGALSVAVGWLTWNLLEKRILSLQARFRS